MTMMKLSMKIMMKRTWISSRRSKFFNHFILSSKSRNELSFICSLICYLFILYLFIVHIRLFYLFILYLFIVDIQLFYLFSCICLLLILNCFIFFVNSIYVAINLIQHHWVFFRQSVDWTFSGQDLSFVLICWNGSQQQFQTTLFVIGQSMSI